MNQSIEVSRQLTREEAAAQAAALIAKCPEWCTEDHSSQLHPQDVRHAREVGETAIGRVALYAWAIPMQTEDDPQAGITWWAAREGDLTADDAAQLANTMLEARRLLDEITTATA